MFAAAAAQPGASRREIASRPHGGAGQLQFVGIPEQLADYIVSFQDAGGGDGFAVMSSTLPDDLDAFVDHVVPLLRRAGRFRTGYEGSTLREHLGVPRPDLWRRPGRSTAHQTCHCPVPSDDNARVTSDPTPTGDDRRRRGRPRDEARRAAILAAAGDLMLEGGLPAATMEAIAVRAGVSKQTIYNWWPSRGAVAMEGFMLRADPLGKVPEGVSASEALRILAVELVRLFRSPAGALMRSLVAEAQSQAELADALRAQWLAPRRASVVAIVEAGIAAGEFVADTDVDLAMDHVFAPIYYRLLLEHRPLTERFAIASVDQLLAGIRRRE